jgi:hypothetical protein
MGNMGLIDQGRKLSNDMRRIDRNLSASAILKSDFFNLPEAQRDILRIGLANCGIE